MLTITKSDSEVGAALADRLGLNLNKREGHDLAGPCIACKSSDAFRLHIHTGVAHCYSCQGKWSPFQLAEALTGDRGRAKALLVELGLFKSDGKGNGKVEARLHQSAIMSARRFSRRPTVLGGNDRANTT